MYMLKYPCHGCGRERNRYLKYVTTYCDNGERMS